MKVSIKHSFKQSVLALLALLLAACGGGGGGSDNGNGGGGVDGNSAPIANAGPDQVARSQSEVILSGRNSHDSNGPISAFDLVRTGGPDLSNENLIRETLSTWKFLVPKVFQETTWEFEIRATDGEGATGADRVSVTALPVQDPNRFLTFLSVPTTFKVVAATSNSNQIQGADIDFTIAVQTIATYTAQDGTQHNVTLSTNTTGGTWLGTAGSAGPDCGAFNNPRFEFNIPSLDIDDLPNVNKALRDEVTVNVTASLDSVSVVDTSLCILDSQNDVIRQGKEAIGGLNSQFTIPLQELLAAAGQENLDTTAAYYKAIDPDNAKKTLSNWLLVNGFTGNTENFDNGGPAEATYVNGFDLGFGRHMFMRKEPVTGNVAAYVINHPNLDSVVERTNVLATVAMEYSPHPSGGQPYTKFYTFVPNPFTGQDERVSSFDFDGRGEKYFPGICTTCHGGGPKTLIDDPQNPGSRIYPDNGNVGASFLPWDVDTLFFSDEQFGNRDRNRPAATGMSLADQQDEFKNFNSAVLVTGPAQAVRDLVEGWYGGPGLPSDTFKADFVPEGWQSGINGNPDSSDNLYLDVVGPHCRSCHTVRADSGTPPFVTYSQFIDSDIRRRVFEEGSMPLARLTMDNFWTIPGSFSSSAELLRQHLGLPAEVTPGIPKIPERVLQTPVDGFKEGNTVRFDASDSLFTDRFEWSFDEPLPPGSSAVLVGANTAEPAFQPDVPGEYVVRLNVFNLQGTDTKVIPISTLNRNPIVMGETPLAIAQGATLSVLAPDGLLQNDSDPDGDTLSVSGILTAPTNGTASVSEEGAYEYTHNGTNTQFDSFTYEVIDGRGGSAIGTVNISINTTDTTSPSQPTNVSVVPPTDNPSSSTQLTVSWTASESASGIKEYIVSRTRIDANGVRTMEPVNPVVNNATTFMDTGLVSDTRYEYTIEAIGNDNLRSGPSQAVESRTKVSYTIDINQIFSIDLERIGRTNTMCISCHGSSGGLTLDNLDPVENCNEVKANRVNTIDPTNSLLLLKPGNGSLTTHGGGKFTSFDTQAEVTGSNNYAKISRWIRQGAMCN